MLHRQMYTVPYSTSRVELDFLVCKSDNFLPVDLQCAAKKVSTKVICHFLSNHLEFLREILQVYYLFIYT